MTPARTALAAACAACALAAGQAPDRPQFRSTASGVRLVAWVLEDGQPVGNLRSEDFELHDNGTRQSVTVTEVRDGALDIALVVPASGSESALGAAHARFVRGALRPDDTFEAVASRAGAVALESVSAMTDATSGRAGATTVDASMAAVLRFASSGTDERLRVLMVFAGRDADDSWARPADLSVLAHRLNAVAVLGALGDIGFDRIGSRGGGTLSYARSGREIALVPSRPLRDLANSTGGRVVDLRQLDGQKALGQLIQQLRTHYVVTYTPTGVKRPGWHEVRLRVRGGLTVIVRSGYWGSASEPAP